MANKNGYPFNQKGGGKSPRNLRRLNSRQTDKRLYDPALEGFLDGAQVPDLLDLGEVNRIRREAVQRVLKWFNTPTPHRDKENEEVIQIARGLRIGYLVAWNQLQLQPKVYEKINRPEDGPRVGLYAFEYAELQGYHGFILGLQVAGFDIKTIMNKIYEDACKIMGVEPNEDGVQFVEN